MLGEVFWDVARVVGELLEEGCQCGGFWGRFWENCVCVGMKGGGGYSSFLGMIRDVQRRSACF